MLKRFFSETAVKILLYIGAPLMLIFSVFWTAQDNALNLWPLVYWWGFLLFFFVMWYLFRKTQ